MHVFADKKPFYTLLRSSYCIYYRKSLHSNTENYFLNKSLKMLKIFILEIKLKKFEN